MNRKLLTTLASGAVVASLATGGLALADSGGFSEGPDVPITGAALEQASAVALDHIGDGRVTGTEEGDEESYYEVEITRDDGSEVDVQLDEGFNVVSDEVDRPGDD